MNTDGDDNFARREMRGGRPDSGTLNTKCSPNSRSPRTAEKFPVVASLPPKFFGGREATAGNASAVRRLNARRKFTIT